MASASRESVLGVQEIHPSDHTEGRLTTGAADLREVRLRCEALPLDGAVDRGKRGRGERRLRRCIRELRRRLLAPPRIEVARIDEQSTGPLLGASFARERLAKDVYDAQLVGLNEGGSAKRIVRAVWAAAAGWPPGLLPLPIVAHLVITERATGATVLNRPVDSGEAGGILAYVRNRMAIEPPERFRVEMGNLYYVTQKGLWPRLKRYLEGDWLGPSPIRSARIYHRMKAGVGYCSA